MSVKTFVLAVFGLGAAAACTRVVDAVTGGDCLPGSPDPTCARTPWPTADHSANSDPWLVRHHDVITQMHPRVLVLNFDNGATTDAARQTAMAQIAALAEGSRYHAYVDATAVPFLQYEIASVVSLTDNPPPAGWTNPSSTLLPTDTNGQFDPLALFSAQFADLYGFTDDADASRSLSLCELFERGIVNEVWIEDGEPGLRRAPLYLERKQTYDQAMQAVPAKFDDCVAPDCLHDIICKVTVRLAHLDPARGPGCDLEVRGWGIEGMWGQALPRYSADADAFLNQDFATRFGVRFNSWSEICDQAGTPCVSYPTETRATGSYADGTPWVIDPFRQGCGDTQFPPNASQRGDFASMTAVQSRCEHFGLHDGPDGGDTYEVYTSDKVAAEERAFPDCGGGWQVYWRQSMPGYGNQATASDGRPMKNWWPFLFY